MVKQVSRVKLPNTKGTQVGASQELTSLACNLTAEATRSAGTTHVRPAAFKAFIVYLRAWADVKSNTARTLL